MSDPLSVYVASCGPPIRLLDEKIDTESNLWIDAKMGADACCAVDWAAQYASLMSRSRNEVNNFAALRIQQMIRMYLARNRLKHLQDYKRIEKGLRVMRKVLQFKVKIMRNRPFNRACIVIQRCWRGSRARDALFRKIVASLVIGKAWKKYSLKVLLQASLRRIERPVEIRFNSLENIPAQSAEGNILIRVSVWWFSLLHIATGQDCITAIQTKKPQCVWTSKPQPLTVVEMDDPLDGVSGRSRSPSAGAFLESLGVRNRSGSNPAEPDGSRGRSNSNGPPVGILRCEMAGLRVLIPSCHGNSVIKFEVLDQDERRLCAYVYFLRSKNMLMFWGGKERIPLALKFQVRRQQRRQSSEKSMNVSSPSVKSSASIESTSNSSTGDSSNNSPASLLPSSPMTRRRGNIADPGALLKRRASIAVAAKVSGVRRRSSVAFSEFNANNVAPTEEESIFFNLDVKSGIRGDWCIVRVKGAGPLYRKSLHAGGSSFLSFMFPVWLRLFVSLTADRLSFSDSRTLLTPSFDVSLYDIESVEAVLSSESKLISQIYPQSGNKSQHTDNHDIVITTKDSDVLLIRMGHPRQRKFMIYEIEHAMAKLDTEDAPRKSFIGNLKHRLTGDLRPAGDSKTGIVIRPSFLRAAKNTKVEDSNLSSSDSSSSSSSEGDDESSDDEKEASKNTKKKHHKTQVTSPIRKAFDRPSSSRVAPEI